jgi:hypothetical protein
MDDAVGAQFSSIADSADNLGPIYRGAATSKPLGIREMARELGVTPRALRFYEAKGLVSLGDGARPGFMALPKPSKSPWC